MKKIQMIVGTAGLGYPGQIVEVSDKKAAAAVNRGAARLVTDDEDVSDESESAESTADESESTGGFTGVVPSTLDQQTGATEEMS